MLNRDQHIEVEAVRLWRRGFRERRLTSKLMKKYGLDRDEAKYFAGIGRSVNLGKFIPDWSKNPRLGSENAQTFPVKKSIQK